MLIFLIPVYNEEENLQDLLKNISNFVNKENYGCKLVFINDGSTDKTRIILDGFKSEINIKIIDQIPRRGAGEAFRKGFLYVSQVCNNDDTVITMEGDNTSDLGILKEMMERIDRTDDVVLASCYAKKGRVEGTDIFRRILSAGANFILKTVFPIKGIHTYSSFYRAYKGSIIKRAINVYKEDLIKEKGFACMVELLIKLYKLGISIGEVPMVLKCKARKDKSKMKIVKTIFGYLRVIGKNISRF